MVVANSEGTLMWIPPMILKCRCEADTTEFPFDEHICHFIIGSWTHHEGLIHPFLEDGPAGFNLEDYAPSRLWTVIRTFSNISSKTHKCCGDDKYPKMIFSLHLRRNPDVQKKLLLIPASSLPILAMLIFWIPPERPDRIGLGKSSFERSRQSPSCRFHSVKHA